MEKALKARHLKQRGPMKDTLDGEIRKMYVGPSCTIRSVGETGDFCSRIEEHKGEVEKSPRDEAAWGIGGRE